MQALYLNLTHSAVQIERVFAVLIRNGLPPYLFFVPIIPRNHIRVIRGLYIISVFPQRFGIALKDKNVIGVFERFDLSAVQIIRAVISERPDQRDICVIVFAGIELFTAYPLRMRFRCVLAIRTVTEQHRQAPVNIVHDEPFVLPRHHRVMSDSTAAAEQIDKAFRVRQSIDNPFCDSVFTAFVR